MAKKIRSEVQDVLQRATSSEDGKMLTLPPGQLDRKLYMAVHEVLLAAGGKWSTKKKAHIFASDARDKISAMLDNGEIKNESKEADYFPTPKSLAAHLVALARIQPGHTVLEPSAGRGAIVAEILDAGAERVECCELLQENRLSLKNMILSGHGLGKMRINEEPDFIKADLGDFDRVVMNPPFSAEIEHVRKAHSLLKDDGLLVAVMSSGVRFRNDCKTVTFRQFVEDLGGEFTDLPSNSFRSSGTCVNTVTLVLPA
jgi:predicted RNA methylase